MSDCKKLIFTLDEIKTMIEEYINSSSSGNSEIDYILSSFEAKILNDYARENRSAVSALERSRRCRWSGGSHL